MEHVVCDPFFLVSAAVLSSLTQKIGKKLFLLEKRA